MDDRSKERLKDVGAVSTTALPFLAYALFSRRQKKLLQLVNDHLSKSKRKISLSEVKRLFQKERKLWKADNYDLSRLELSELPEGKPLGYGNYFRWRGREGVGGIHLSVRGVDKARSKGVNTDVFLHELGHAHEGYRHHPHTTGGVLWRHLAGSIMPVPINPVYREEVRAWRNAGSFGKGLDERARDLTLGTYRNAIRGRQATYGSGLLSAAILKDRFSGDGER